MHVLGTVAMETIAVIVLIHVLVTVAMEKIPFIGTMEESMLQRQDHVTTMVQL
jgi:hypothetical protein